MKIAEYWIRKLKLKKHPEGRYYREIYKSSEKVSTARGKRSVATAIYFLLKYPSDSHFHRIASDEIWRFYEGNDLTVWMLNSKTKKTEKQIISSKNGRFCAVVPAGV